MSLLAAVHEEPPSPHSSLGTPTVDEQPPNELNDENEELIEMDGYDMHNVDWSTPKGMTPVEDIVARIMILHRFAKIGMAEDDSEAARLAKLLVHDLKNTPSQEMREQNTRARWKMDFSLWDKCTRREIQLLTQKPFTPSKFNLKAQTNQVIFALLWVLKVVKDLPPDFAFDKPSPLQSIKNIHKFLACKDIWEMREHVPNFNLRKREHILELIDHIEHQYLHLHALYVRQVTNLKPVSNDLIMRLDNLMDWYKALKFATQQATDC